MLILCDILERKLFANLFATSVIAIDWINVNNALAIYKLASVKANFFTATISIVPINPFDISSVKSDNLFGAIIDIIEPKNAKTIAININILKGFNSENSLFIAPLKSFALSVGSPPLPIGPPLGII